MSAFKKLDRKDVFTTVHLAYKSWTVSGSNASQTDLSFLSGVSGSLVYIGTEDLASLKYPSYSYNQFLQYRSTRQLYYGNITPELLTGSFEEYNQTSIYSGSRSLGNRVGVVSFPRSRYGVGIKPGSIAFDVNTSYIQDESNYVLETLAAGGQYIENYPSGSVIDNGEGQIVTVGSYAGKQDGDKVGDIFYNHGIISFTEPYFDKYFSNQPVTNFSWKSIYPVYTTNYKLKVLDEEFNFTLNPTSTKDEFGNIASNVSSSEFRPYVTSIGLYNDDQQLIAVAKLSQPIPKSTDTDMTFVVKLDI